MVSGPEIEKQTAQLNALEAEGKLTTEAARKAAAALALQVEYLASGREALKPGAAATEAGEQLVEMTVDRPGMLGGIPPSTEVLGPREVQQTGQEGAP